MCNRTYFNYLSTKERTQAVQVLTVLNTASGKDIGCETIGYRLIGIEVEGDKR